MIEAMQNKRFKLPEPGEDVINQINEFLEAQIKILRSREVMSSNEIN